MSDLRETQVNITAEQRAKEWLNSTEELEYDYERTAESKCQEMARQAIAKVWQYVLVSARSEGAIR